MDVDIWIYYALAVLVLTASPGPSSLLCMTVSVTSGLKSGIFTALGSLTAITAILSLSFTGLGVIIASSEWVFNIIKWVGAGYLIYLGVKAFLSKQDSYDVDPASGPHRQRTTQSFVSGFIVGASNPKAILFFTALFPQFIDSASPLLPQYVVFATTFITLELSWLLTYSFLGSKSSKWLMAKGRARVFNKLTGTVFVSAGAVLSTASRG
ncbi:flagellar biosynthesis protein FlgM [Veronia nyctiphanis]|uniref:Flagellar biosynthesis protein FlgM n=1 Tax=Veronia nyctiphanis TaxID=1278244 RepID=A0A4V1LSX2_9GAMM|nr:LysE family translocator [Veronia nyctiphanis]RXJ73188.1 flagellar biosynthesis protein FlgM [Veronia nyctiphanis]